MYTVNHIILINEESLAAKCEQLTTPICLH